MQRRTFLKLTGAASASLALAPSLFANTGPAGEPFKISLAEWSINRHLKHGKLKHLDFPKLARREFKLDAVELVDQFFSDKYKDNVYLRDLRRRADGEGVKIWLIMLDTNGPLGAADETARSKAVTRTIEWMDAAALLGCQVVRVNAYGDGTPDQLKARIVESCSKLADAARERNLQLTIENHGGPSSDAAWLTSVMREVNKPNFGTLPDFGNFPPEANRYEAVEKMLPYARAVSAKAMKFNESGMVEETDFFRMMRLVRDGGYFGYVGIESAPDTEADELNAIRLTRDLLRWIQDEEARCLPIFNGKDLTGWKKIEGGDWTVENGVLIGRNGINWTTNPEKTGSWLSTEKPYKDFRLELQYTVNQNGNSGIFFRSAHEKNPAFTGYEVQIYDAPGRPPSKTGPGSIYDTVAPTKNLVRPAGEWNTVTITAQEELIRVEMNGETILQTSLKRSMEGYIGLQNHDDKSEVRFRNIRLEVL
ncbi:MAG: family 16 glycoside hydrolase [Verrucomicrobiota bacterium]|nr:family 16 glycoside hydrolase [Verrucomicrobiota bacterium]